MKSLVPIIAIIVVLFSSCANNRNEVMTHFVNEKKMVQDSIKLADNYQAYYAQQAKDSMHSGDSLKWKQYSDTSSFYWNRGRLLKMQLDSLNFSIDSLEKMK